MCCCVQRCVHTPSPSTGRVQLANFLAGGIKKPQSMDPTSWIVRDAVISSRGAKSCPVEYAKHDKGTDGKIHLAIGSREKPTTTPFGATTFDGQEAAQRTIEFNLSDDEVEQFQGVTAWLKEYLAEHSLRIFKREMSQEQVSDSLRSPVTQKGSFQPHLRCKIRPASVRTWDANNKPVALPNDLRGYKLVARLTIDRLWIMSRECGLVLQVTDLMVLPSEETVCPFA